MRALSLFSGAGGMDVGAKSAGCQILGACEKDFYAAETFRQNHRGVEMIEGDINEKRKKLQAFSGVDIIFGGPPCQGFSVAGKMEPSDPRSKLVFSFCSIIELLQPKAFVMENVKALGRLSKFENIRNEIIRRMNYAGYYVFLILLNAKDFGVPQSRERVFFIGLKKEPSQKLEESLEKFSKNAPTLRSSITHLGPVGSKTNPHKTKAKITLAKKPVLRKSPYAGMLFNGQGRPLNPDSWSSTLPATMGGNRTPIIDEEHLYEGKSSWVESYHKKLMNGEIRPQYGEAPSRLRRLTIDEAALLQTFPPNYIFCGPQSKVFNQIGNAVPCLFAEAVIKSVKQSFCRY